jgi:hypothetical protein
MGLPLSCDSSELAPFRRSSKTKAMEDKLCRIRLIRDRIPMGDSFAQKDLPRIKIVTIRPLSKGTAGAADEIC